jgi:hypothetical protein
MGIMDTSALVAMSAVRLSTARQDMTRHSTENTAFLIAVQSPCLQRRCLETLLANPLHYVIDFLCKELHSAYIQN